MNDEQYDGDYEEEKKRDNEKRNFIIRHWIITIILIILFSTFASEITRIQDLYIRKKGTASDSKETIKTIGDDLTEFRKVIDKYYLGEEVDETKLLDSTLKGYVDGLGDEYSTYMSAEEWKEFEENAFGDYCGIGIYMGMDESNNVVVVDVIEDTPAEEAGLKKGDIISEADGKSLIGASTEEVASIVKGEEGTKVNLKIIRDNEVLNFEIERKAIEVYKIKSEFLGDGIGYINIQTFNDNTGEEFKTAYDALKLMGANKFIVDLRSNTGGVVEEALKICDYYTEKGTKLLITRDKDGNELEEKADEGVYIKEETVFLTSEYTASASEILAGSLRDTVGAKIIGNKTYGKGVIQSVWELSDGSALKLTIAEYFTPNGTSINKVGIEPDYNIKLKVDANTTDENFVDDQKNAAIEYLKTGNIDLSKYETNNLSDSDTTNVTPNEENTDENVEVKE